MPGRWIILALILLLAAALRICAMDLMEFKGDEAAVLALARSDHLPALGIGSSFGIENPPLFVWMIRVASRCGTDPVFLTRLLAGGLGIGAVLLTFLVLYRRMGTASALGAALLLACGAHPVIHARKLWAQDLLPFFLVVLIAVLLVILERKRTRWWALLPGLLWVLFSLHPTSLAVLPAVLTVLFLRRHALHGKALLLGSAPVLILALWYGGALARAHGHDSVPEAGGALWKLVPGTLADRWVFLSGDALAPALEITTGTDLSPLLGSSGDGFVLSPGVLRLRKIASLAGRLLLLLGLLAATTAARRRQWTGRPVALLALAFVGSTVLVFVSARPEPFHPHYLLSLYPAAFILMALPFATGSNKILASLGALFLLTWCTGQIATLHAARGFLERSGGSPGEYGVAYRYKAQVASWIVDNGNLLKSAPGPEYEFLIDQRAPLATPSRERTPVAIYDTLSGAGAAPNLRACARGRKFGPLVACPDP